VARPLAPMTGPQRIAIVWHRADHDTKQRRRRLDGVFRALEARGAVAEAVVYAEESADAVRERLLGSAAVLVWVNPVTAGHDRTQLDALLRDVAATGVRVSAHPDVVATLGTKAVLHHTRTLGCGSDVQLHRDLATLERTLPSRLAAGACVLKRERGNDGLGVYKVELDATGVRVEHAHDGAVERLPLSGFLERFAGDLAAGGCVVEQPYLPRVAEGMVRCYVSGGAVAGFAEHLPRGLLPTAGVASGLGHDKVMHGPDAAPFQALRTTLEREWIPGMQRLLGLSTEELPVIWDADFLRGPATSEDDAWVLCEINASCVSPFPSEAAHIIAATTLARVRAPARGDAPRT
jgi:hypothetical protein